MADLPASHLTACNKLFKSCWFDYLNAFRSRQNCSECKAWGFVIHLFMHWMLTCGIGHDPTFERFSQGVFHFTNLRGSVETIYSGNASDFYPASERLPILLGSTEFHNALRKRNINWIKIIFCAPSREVIGKNMIELLKNAPCRVLKILFVCHLYEMIYDEYF